MRGRSSVGDTLTKIRSSLESAPHGGDRGLWDPRGKQPQQGQRRVGRDPEEPQEEATAVRWTLLSRVIVRIARLFANPCPEMATDERPIRRRADMELSPQHGNVPQGIAE